MPTCLSLRPDHHSHKGASNGQWTGFADAVGQVGHSDGMGPNPSTAGSLSSWNSAHTNLNCSNTAPRGGAWPLLLLRAPTPRARVCVDTGAGCSRLRASARWGASCPRQGKFPPNRVRTTREPSSGLLSADVRHFCGRKVVVTDDLTAATRLESLRKDAKRWLKTIRAGDAHAIERLRRACPDAPSSPGLRDVQHALARERGFDGWRSLTASARRADDHRSAVARQIVAALLKAAVDGDATRSPPLLDRQPDVIDERGHLTGIPVCGRRCTSPRTGRTRRSCGCCSSAAPIPTSGARATGHFRCISSPRRAVSISSVCSSNTARIRSAPAITTSSR